MSDKPYALVDVDGVLNAFPECGGPPYCRCHPHLARVFVRPGGRKFRLYVNPQHGRMLLDFAGKTGAELAWGTMWEEDANTYVGPAVGLPKLPVAPLPVPVPAESLGIPASQWPGGVRPAPGRLWTPPTKAHGFVPWMAGRPFVWFEDEPEEKAAADELATQPHHVVLVDPREGLQQAHLDEAAAWLADLAQRQRERRDRWT
jgi:hypothetical protein